jgi:hypothetical protein
VVAELVPCNLILRLLYQRWIEIMSSSLWENASEARNAGWKLITFSHNILEFLNKDAPTGRGDITEHCKPEYVLLSVRITFLCVFLH